jgi:pimeloyl-ACP methyl ester carboxylesterase
MLEVELSAGRIEYQDTGGGGPVVVLVHGLLMDATLWDAVTADLSADHRCIVPTLPLGAHRLPVAVGADLSVRGLAALVAEFFKCLGLNEVTVAGNDTGGAIVQILAAEHSERVGRIALVSCDAFGNFPPGLTGKALVAAGKLPPALFGAFMQQMRLKPARRAPFAYGWLTKRGDQACRRCLQPLLTSPAIRRDTTAALRAIAADPGVLTRVATQLPGFTRPALIAWAARDRVMPPEHGRRLAKLLPDARHVEIPDSYTLIPLDQPALLARELRTFIRETPLPAAGTSDAANSR